MAKEKVINDIALRFWKGEQLDEVAAEIMSKIPSGSKNNYIKTAICELYKKQQGEKKALTSDNIREIVKEEVSSVLSSSLASQQQELLIQMSNMIGKLEGSFQNITISPAADTTSATLAPVKEDVKEKEDDIPDFALDFLNNMK